MMTKCSKVCGQVCYKNNKLPASLLKYSTRFLIGTDIRTWLHLLLHLRQSATTGVARFKILKSSVPIFYFRIDRSTSTLQ